MQLGFAGLLTIVFIALKLVGYITWSWIWVVSPLWIGFILWVVVAFLLVLFMGFLERPRIRKKK